MTVEELYTQMWPKLARWCAALCGGDRALGEDIAQEAFLRALRHMDQLEDMGMDQCRSWLYRTARNLHVDRRRKYGREIAGLEEGFPEPGLEEDFSRGAVAELVGRLPAEERMLFWMRHFEGYNATELGERFRLPPATVRSRLLSARQRLRAWLDKEG